MTTTDHCATDEAIAVALTNAAPAIEGLRAVLRDIAGSVAPRDVTGAQRAFMNHLGNAVWQARRAD